MTDTSNTNSKLKEKIAIAIAIIMAIPACIQIFEWISNIASETLIAEVHVNEYYQIPTIISLIDTINARYYRNAEVLEELEDTSDNHSDTLEGRTTIINTLTRLQDFSIYHSYSFSPSYVVEIDISNIGENEIRNLTIFLPDFNFALVKKENDKVTQINSVEPLSSLQVESLLPGSFCTIIVWVSYISEYRISDDIKLSHPVGKGEVKLYGEVSPFWFSLYRIRMLIIFMLPAVVAIVLFMIFSPKAEKTTTTDK